MKKGSDDKRTPKSSGRSGNKGNKNFGSRYEGDKRPARRSSSGFKDSGYRNSDRSYRDRDSKGYPERRDGERSTEKRYSDKKSDYRDRDSRYGKSDRGYGDTDGKGYPERGDGERSTEKRYSDKKSASRDRDSGYGKSDKGYGDRGPRRYSGRDSGHGAERAPYKKRFTDGDEGSSSDYGKRKRSDKNYPIGKVVKKEWEKKDHRPGTGGRSFERREGPGGDNRYGRDNRGRRDEYRGGSRYGSAGGFRKDYTAKEEVSDQEYIKKDADAQEIKPEIHQDYIIGRKPVLEALRANARIEKIYFRYGLQGEILKDIKTEARRNKIEVVELPENKFSRYGTESNTQGVVALRGMVKTYELEELIEAAKEGNKTLLILDNIQDPQNLGAIIRSAECFGIDGVIITLKNSAPINETVSKVSAGALEYVKMHKSANLGISIEKLKESGFWVVGTTLSDSATGLSVDEGTLVVVVMGNEEKGVRQSILKDCDMTYKIPLKGKLQSLNVSVATGVTLFEINRLRQIKKL